MVYDIIQMNFIGIVIIIFLILFILVNSNFDKKTNRLFLCSAVCVLLLIVEEVWERQLAIRSTYTYLRVVLSAIGYTLRPMTAYFLVLIICRNAPKWRPLISIPIIINTIVALSALFCKWAFWYTESNEFIRGPLGVIPFITAGFYVLIILAVTIRDCKKGSIMEAVIVVAIVMLAVIATIMESLYYFQAIQSAASGVSITFYYLFLHTNQNNRDLLTKALIRRRFYLDAERYHSTLTAVVSLDLNNLKELNDQYGHMEGDKALVTMTNVVRRCIKKKAAIYRTGGDEFMILCHKVSEEEVQEMIAEIQSAMENTEYRCAIGYSLYHHREGLDQACQTADHAMYENKRKMKAKKKETETVR